MSLPHIEDALDNAVTLLSEVRTVLPRISGSQQEGLVAEVERLTLLLKTAVPDVVGHRSRSVPPSIRNSGEERHGRESWLERALNEARMGAWEWEVIAGDIRWTQGMYDLYGVDPSRGPIGHDEFIRMIHPDDQQNVRNEFAEAARRNGLFSHEFRFTCPDGRMLWIHSAGAVEAGPDGQIMRIGGINQDITDPKRGEQALRESRERERLRAAELEALMDAVPAIIWIAKDPLCREIEGNQYGNEFLRMPAGANLSKTAGDPKAVELQPYYQVENGQRLPADRLPMQMAASSGQAVREHEIEILFSDGTTKYAFGNAVPILDAEGRPAGAVGAFLDITDRKRAEQELRESRKRIAQLLETSYEGIWSVDAQGVTTFVNPRAAEIVGYSLEEIQGRDAFQFLMAGEVEKGHETLERIRRGLSGRVEARVQRKGGEEAWLLVSFSPLISEEGQFQGALAMFTDISARKRMEETLARTAQELQEAQRIAHLGSWHWNADTDQTTGSDELYRVFGLDPQSDPFPDFRDQKGVLYPPEVWERLNAEVQRAARTGEGYELDLPALRRGEPIWIITRGERVYDSQGRLLGLRGTVQDITERKRAEEAVTRLEIQKRLVEQSERERQNYAREIHDGPVQTLAAIGLNVSFIQDAFPDPALRLELEQIGRAVQTAGRELRQVINEMRPPSPLRFGLSQAIEFHAQGLRERAPKIEWEIRLAPDPGILTEAARLAMFRIYQEATTNIIRHAEAGRAWVRFQVRKNSVALEVGDNGRGMETDQQAQGSQGEYHFGLAGMQERAEAIGARLEIESAPGKGTRVRVILPVKHGS